MNSADIFFADTITIRGWKRVIVVMEDEIWDKFDDEALAHNMSPGEWFKELNKGKFKDNDRVKVIPMSLCFGLEDEDE